MWKKLPYTIPIFLSFVKRNGYFIYITDYISVWWVYYKETEFLNVLKQSNDDLEMECDEEFVKKGLKMLTYPENLRELQLNYTEKTLDVSMILLDGFSVFLDMKLTKGSREMFFEIITQPLLKTVHDLKTSENELRFSLVKKDKEIDEYKSETDIKLAMYLKTAVFNDEEHMKKHSVYQESFGTLDLPSCLLDRVVTKAEDLTLKQENQIEESKVEIKTEFEHIKHETSQVPESNNQNNVVSTIRDKREVKREPQNIPKKRLKKILKL